MIVYIDKTFRCHATFDDRLIEIDSGFFDNKSPTFIDGYRFIPEGQTWTRDDGVVFSGEMIAPAVPIEPLLIAQAEFERTQAVMLEAYKKGVNSV